MERLAEDEGGTDALIEVLARDMSSAYDLLRISQRLCGDGRDNEALEWIACGLKEFSPEARLRSLAAECHLRATCVPDAARRPSSWCGPTSPIARGWTPTSRRTTPPPRHFPAGVTRRWPCSEKDASPPIRDHSTLVEVLLWEGEAEGAWQAAVKGGCHPQLRLRVARERAVTHPADAIPVLLRAAGQWIEHKNRGAYQDAAKLLVEARALFARCDRHGGFEYHLRALRAAHKPKRALREELDRARLP